MVFSHCWKCSGLYHALSLSVCLLCVLLWRSPPPSSSGIIQRQGDFFLCSKKYFTIVIQRQMIFSLFQKIFCNSHSETDDFFSAQKNIPRLGNIFFFLLKNYSKARWSFVVIIIKGLGNIFSRCNSYNIDRSTPKNFFSCTRHRRLTKKPSLILDHWGKKVWNQHPNKNIAEKRIGPLQHANMQIA